jgi:hypothetical protein
LVSWVLSSTSTVLVLSNPRFAAISLLDAAHLFPVDRAERRANSEKPGRARPSIQTADRRGPQYSLLAAPLLCTYIDEESALRSDPHLEMHTRGG